MNTATTHETNNVNPEELIVILKEQLDLYRKLQKLASRQRDLITGENSQALMRLLGDRQQIIDSLSVLNKRLVPAQTAWRNYQNVMTVEKRSEAERLLREVGASLNNILSSDREDAKIMTARKSQTSSKLRSINSISSANVAYIASSNKKTVSLTDQSA